MMLNVPAIRTELAGLLLLPSGWTAYDSVKGVQSLPAVVVGMPDSIEELSNNVFQVDLPLIVVIGNHTPESEADLLNVATSIATANRSVQGTAFRSATWQSINQFTTVTVGQVESLAAHVNLTVTA